MYQNNSTLCASDIEYVLNIYSQMKGSKNLKMLAIGGNEGNRVTYVGKIRFKQLAEHFDLVPFSSDTPNKIMLQRELVKSRAANITSYIQSNKDFIFPELISICETINAEAIPGYPSLFNITLPADSFRYLVDGQGRLSGIKKAIEENPELVEQTIDIKLVQSAGLKNDSQLFSDVNMTPVSPNKSQCAAMDSRLTVNRFAKHVVEQIDDLSSIIDYTKASVTSSSKSANLWTLNQMVSFVLLITGTTAKSCEKELSSLERQEYWTKFIEKYFSTLQQNKLFNAAITKELSAQEVRQQSVIGTSVLLKSLAIMGKVLVMHFIARGEQQADWSILDGWKQIDLSHNNKNWIGRCKNYRGGYEDKSFNHKAMASYFLIEMGLEVPEDLETIEEEVLLHKAKIMKQNREAEKAEKSRGNLAKESA